MNLDEIATRFVSLFLWLGLGRPWDNGIQGRLMNTDKERIRLDRQRLAIEARLKRRDQQFQRYQFDISRRGIAGWAHVVTPVGAAVIAAIRVKRQAISWSDSGLKVA